MRSGLIGLGVVVLVVAGVYAAWRAGVGRAPEVGGIPSWAKVAPEQIDAAKEAGVPVAFENSLGMRFVLIPAGTFLMGSQKAQEWFRNEMPEHEVILSKPYYLSIYETTNEEYKRFEPAHDSDTKSLHGTRTLGGDAQPVVRVSHGDALEFLAWLNRKDRRHTYRLPTEAEWERACRAGSTTPYSFGTEITLSQANFGEGATTIVGSFPANAWGLHDMHGNAGEWCADWFGAFSSDRAVDPKGPASGTYRILRGGSWGWLQDSCRSASRSPTYPMSRSGYGGFRVAASVTPR